MRLCFLFVFALCSLNVKAQNIHFFGSIQAAQTNISNEDVKFDDIANKVTISPLTTAGFNIDSNFNDKYQALAQFIYNSSDAITVDLLQLRYNFTSDDVVRLGRQRLPFFLFSEHIQVQALLPWLNAPREVYSRTPIYSFTGISYEKQLGELFNFHLYGGDTKNNFKGGVDYEASTNNLLGLRLNMTFNKLKTYLNLYRADGDLTVKTDIAASNPDDGTRIGYEKKFELHNIQGLSSGFQYRTLEYFLMSEYSLLKSNDDAFKKTSAMYVTLGKEINEKWVPVITYSTDLEVDSDISPSKTSTYAFNLNYRLDYNNVFKIGYQHVNFNSQSSPLNNGFVSVFTDGDPGQNFDVYSLMWAFVY